LFCPNIIAEVERFVKTFLKLFQESRNFIYQGRTVPKIIRRGGVPPPAVPLQIYWSYKL